MAKRVTKRAVGFLWQKEHKDTKTDYLAGYIVLFRCLKIKIKIFYNRYKAERAPDWRIYLDEDQTQMIKERDFNDENNKTSEP